MEIHAPHGTVHSARDFFLHIAMITIGVLIALSAEGIREVVHNHNLVSEARENIRHELEENRDELRKMLTALPAAQKQQSANVAAIAGLLRNRRTEVHSLSMSTQLANLRSAAWNTAAATGALGHMSYTEVARFARSYELQQQFVQMQQRVLDIFARTPVGDPNQASERELEDLKERFQAALVSLQFLEGLGKSAASEYDRALNQN